MKIPRQTSLNKLPVHFSRHSCTYKFMHAYFLRAVSIITRSSLDSVPVPVLIPIPDKWATRRVTTFFIITLKLFLGTSSSLKNCEGPPRHPRNGFHHHPLARPLVPHFGAISGFVFVLASAGFGPDSRLQITGSPSHLFLTHALVVLVYIFGSALAVSFAILIARGSRIRVSP